MIFPHKRNSPFSLLYPQYATSLLSKTHRVCWDQATNYEYVYGKDEGAVEEEDLSWNP